MELIQALEQLSLHVKTKRSDISSSQPQYQQSTLATSGAPSNSHQQWTCMNIDTHFVDTGEGYHHSQAPDVAGSRRQLQDFDNSIETLFAQISELDCLKASHPQQLPLDASVRRNHYNYNKNTRQANSLRIQAHAGGSMETSQEEDSDCSSSQHSYNQNVTTNRANVCVDPLVKDLLKRDLRDITNTVRKIGTIIKVGDEIETIYNRNLFSARSQQDTSNSCQQNELTYSRSLCDTFMDLCSSEPHIMDLPTIIRYRDYCHRLMTQLNKFNQYSSSSYSSVSRGAASEADDIMMDSNATDGSAITSPLGSGGIGTGDEDDVEYGEAGSIDNDAAFLACDQKDRGNWTENKLYIDHR